MLFAILCFLLLCSRGAAKSNSTCHCMRLNGQFETSWYVIATQKSGYIAAAGTCTEEHGGECEFETCLEDGCYVLSFSDPERAVENDLSWDFGSGFLRSTLSNDELTFNFTGPHSFCSSSRYGLTQGLAEIDDTWDLALNMPTFSLSPEEVNTTTDINNYTELKNLLGQNHSTTSSISARIATHIYFEGQPRISLNSLERIVILDGGYTNSLTETRERMQLRGGEDLCRGFFGVASGVLTLSRLLLENCNLLFDHLADGAIVLKSGGELRLYDCILRDLGAVRGAAVQLYGDSVLYVLNSEFIGNYASRGGVFDLQYDDSGSPQVSVANSTFVQNIAISGGSVVNLDCGTIHFEDSGFVQNAISSSGTTESAGIIFDGPSMTVPFCFQAMTARRCEVSENYGGAPFFKEGMAWFALAQSNATNNVNPVSCGGVLCSYSAVQETIFLSDIIAKNNTSGEYGGFMFISTLATTIYGPLGSLEAVSNQALYGGVIAVDIDVDVSLYVNYLEVSHNVAIHAGGFLYALEKAFVRVNANSLYALENYATDASYAYLRPSATAEFQYAYVTFSTERSVLQTLADTTIEFIHSTFLGSNESIPAPVESLLDAPPNELAFLDISSDNARLLLDSTSFADIHIIESEDIYAHLIRLSENVAAFLNNVSFHSNTGIQSVMRVEGGAQVYISNCQISSNTVLSAALMCDDPDTILTLDKTLLSDNFGGAILISSACVVNSLSSIFLSNSADMGGAVLIEEFGYFLSYEDQFVNNRALTGSGGAVYVSASAEFSINASSPNHAPFLNNSADSGGGGAIYFEKYVVDSKTSDDYISVACEKLKALQNTTMNKALFGNGCASTINEFYTFWNNTSAETSGVELSTPIVGVLLDAFGNIVKTIDESSAVVVALAEEADDSVITVAGAMRFGFFEGSFSSIGLRIIAAPGSTIAMTSTVSIEESNTRNKITFDGSSTVNVDIRPCIDGEITVGFSCVACLPTQYFIDGQCKECKKGMRCGRGVDLADRLIETVQMEKGYMRQSSLSENPIACISTKDYACKYEYGRIGCSISEDAFGPACAVCSARHYWSGDKCISCTSVPRAEFIFKVIVWCFALSIFLYFIFIATNPHSKVVGKAGKITRVRAKLRAKWRTLIVTLQILTQLRDLLGISVRFPTNYLNFMQLLNFLSLSIPLECVRKDRFSLYDKLFSLTLGPLVFAILIAIVILLRSFAAYRRETRIAYSLPDAHSTGDQEVDTITTVTMAPNSRVSRNHVALHSNNQRRQYLDKASSEIAAVCILVSFLFYPSTSTVILQTFATDSYDNPDGKPGQVRYLRFDVALRDKGRRRHFMRLYATLCVALTVIGVPLSYLLSLARHRNLIDPHVDDQKPRRRRNELGVSKREIQKAIDLRNHQTAIHHLELLYGPYMPSLWYFECVECVRRFCFTALTIVIAKSAGAKTLYTVAIAFLSQKLYQIAAPFNADSDNLLAQALQDILLVAQLFTLGFVTGILGSQVQYFLIVLVLGAIVLTLWLVIRDIKREKAALELVASTVKDVEHTISHSVHSFEHSFEETLHYTTSQPRTH